MFETKPLQGLTVIEIGHSVAAPYAGSILRQLGAQVIKVENPDGGDYTRDWGPPYRKGTAVVFESLNVGKKSLALNLKDPVQCDKLRALILEKGDVVIQNLRPGITVEMGLDEAGLMAEKPSLVYCNLSAFGATGPMKMKPGYDPLMQAYGGIMSVTGDEGTPPVRVGVSIIDMASGMWSVIGILAALYGRQISKKGCVVDTSLFETALAWMTMHLANYTAAGYKAQRLGSGAPQIVPYQNFQASDGYLMIAAGNDGLFRKLTRVLGKEAWCDDERFASNGARVQNREVLVAMISDEIASGTIQEWATKLDDAGVPNAPIREVDEIVNCEQVKALDILQTMPGTGEAFIGIPICFNGKRPDIEGPVPTLGGDTDMLDAGDSP